MNVLGAVAKGLGDVVLGGGEELGAEGEAVESLLERIATGFLPEDRTAAMARLKDLLIENAGAKSAFGSFGYPMSREVIVDNINDVETVRGITELLYHSLSAGEGNEEEDADADPAAESTPDANPDGALKQAARTNAETFSQDGKNLELLLRLLGDEAAGGVSDFYVRYHTVRVLAALLRTNAWRLQGAVLASPLGVVKLMDVLLEGEVVRNEIILLLIGLTRDNAEIQKLAAFEGGFDHIFNVIREEGNAEGGVVIQDCLELLSSLLANNTSNQLLFRESGHVPKLMAMLENVPSEPGPQMARNLFCVFSVITSLQSPPSCSLADQTLVQTMLSNIYSLLGTLTRLTLSPDAVVHGAVRAQALRCLASLIQSNATNKERLAHAQVEREEGPTPALQATLWPALYAESASESAAACAVLREYCTDNAEGQGVLASTVVPIIDASEGPSTFGSDLLKALVASDPSSAQGLVASFRASLILSYILQGSAGAKDRIANLRIPIDGSSMGKSDILSCLCRIMSTGFTAGKGALLNLSALRTLITWMQGSEAAVSSLLSSPSNVPLIVELCGSKHVHIAGLASILLGLCITAGVQTEAYVSSSFDSKSLVDVISRHIGLHRFFNAWDDMIASSEFKRALAPQRKPALALSKGLVDSCFAPSESDGPSSPHEPSFALVFDRAFTESIKDLQPTVRECIVKSYANPLDNAGGGATPTFKDHPVDSDLTQQLKEEVKQLRARNESLAKDLLAMGSAEAGAGAHENAEAAVMATKAQADIAARESEKSIAEAQRATAQAQEEAAALRERIQELEMLQSDVEAAGKKHEMDLKDLAEAYNTLEAHSFSLEAKLNDANERLEAKPEPSKQVEGAMEDSALALQSVTSELEAAKAERDVLAGRCADYETRLATAEAASADISVASDAAAGLAGENATLKSTLASVKDEMQGIRSQLELKEQLEQSMIQMERAHQAEVDRMQREHEASLASLAAANDKLAAMDGIKTYTEQELLAATEQARTEAAADADEDIFALETKLRDLQTKLVASESSAPSGYSQEALDAAVAKAREEAIGEGEESMNDLLVCLGQEEKKTEVLSEKLQAMGVDVDEILDGIEEDDDEEEEEDA